MTFQPVISGTGMAGWRFLERTYETQFNAFTSSLEIKRDTDYFIENISKIQSAEDLVADRRLLSVALGAFGLGDDLDNRFFIQKVLEDGTKNDDALAKRLSDDRYAKLSEAFGFGPLTLRETGSPGFAEKIVGLFQAESFEEAVGSQDETMRIGLYAQRELAGVANSEGSDATKWFKILGLPPLREAFQTAFGLPDAFAQIDLDQQVSIMKEKSERLFGTSEVSQLADPDIQEKLLVSYIARSQIKSLGSGFSSQAIALQLLQS